MHINNKKKNTQFYSFCSVHWNSATAIVVDCKENSNKTRTRKDVSERLMK